MVQVHEATFTPQTNGGKLRTSVTIGRQEVTMAWLLGREDQNLTTLLDQLTVEVEQVTFASTPAGPEIRAQLRVGDQTFVSRVPVEIEDQALQARVYQLLEEIGRQCIRNLEAALKAGGS